MLNNKKTDLISIIIPVYNAESSLLRCLESIFNQSYKNLEIIIINDGSSDNSGLLCDELAMKDDRITVIHQSNQGVSAARNAGLKACTGDYVGFVDADDIVEANMYEILLENLIQFDCDVSICGVLFEYENGESRKVPSEVIKYKHRRVIAIENALRGNHYSGHLWNKLFRADLLMNIRFNKNIKVYEDMLFFIEALKNSENVIFDSTPLYHYYIHGSSAYNKPFNSDQYTAIEACNLMRGHIRAFCPKLEPLVIVNSLNYCIQLLKKLMVYTGQDKKYYEKLILGEIKKNYRLKLYFKAKSKRLFILITISRINLKLLHFVIRLYSGLNGKSIV